MIMMSRTIFMTAVSVTVFWLSCCCSSTLPVVPLEAFVIVSSSHQQHQRYTCRDNHYQPTTSTQAWRAQAPSFFSLAAATKSKGQADEKVEEAAAAAANNNNATATTNTATAKTNTTRATTTNYEIKESSRLKHVKTSYLPGKEWDLYMDELVKYKKTHGTVNIPRSPDRYPKLSLFVQYIRQNRPKLTEQQKDALDKLGFIWEGSSKVTFQHRWDDMFLELKKMYQNETENTLVSKTDKYNPKLDSWVGRQRNKYKRGLLNEERINKLESINFTWSVMPEKVGPRRSITWEHLWQQRFKELIKFKEEKNHTIVPQNYKENKSLALWVAHQRDLYSKGELLGDRQKLLEEIGFVWDFRSIRDSSWQNHFEEYKIATQNKHALAPNMRQWAYEQRLQLSKNLVDAKRKAQLDEINFNWNFRDDRD